MQIHFVCGRCTVFTKSNKSDTLSSANELRTLADNNFITLVYHNNCQNCIATITDCFSNKTYSVNQLPKYISVYNKKYVSKYGMLCLCDYDDLLFSETVYDTSTWTSSSNLILSKQEFLDRLEVGTIITFADPEMKTNKSLQALFAKHGFELGQENDVREFTYHFTKKAKLVKT